jgi:hypothetical protein
MNAGLLVLGTSAFAVGLLLGAWPAPIYWLDEQTNVRWARWWSEHVYKVREHRWRRRVLRWSVVSFLLVFGALLTLDAFFDLQRGR